MQYDASAALDERVCEAIWEGQAEDAQHDRAQHHQRHRECEDLEMNYSTAPDALARPLQSPKHHHSNSHIR